MLAVNLLAVIWDRAHTLLYGTLFVPFQNTQKESCVDARVPAQVQLHWGLVLKILLQTRWKLCCPALKSNKATFELRNATSHNVIGVGCRRRVRAAQNHEINFVNLWQSDTVPGFIQM